VKRRDFVALLGGTAAWPLTTRAKQLGMPMQAACVTRESARRAMLLDFLSGL
jgi:hypothetical protein